MTPKEMIKKIQNHTNMLSGILSLIHDSINIFHAEGNNVYIEDATYSRNMNTLHKLRESLGTYELQSYYAGASNSLAAVYKFNKCDEFNIMMYFTDKEHALSKVSGGKCVFTTREKTEIESDIVCELEQ